MFQNSVKTSLYGLLGWRQSTVSNMPTVDTPNLATNSGLYYQDFSSIVTIQNVYRCQEDETITDVEFNTYLANLTKAATIKLLNSVFTDDDFIENKVLYPFENVWTETLDNDTSFVGYEIEMPKRKDFAWMLNQIFTSFDSEDTVKILLFHSSKKEPIQTKEITVAELDETATVLEWNLSQFNYSGGKFYLGYLRSGLTAKAINRDWDKANVRANYCTLRVRPIKVSGWNTETLFDVDDIDYESETYGLNLDITAWKDYTNVIVQNKRKFANAIGLQVAADVLEQIIHSTRSNRIERKVHESAFVELNGLAQEGFPRTFGIAKKLGDEIKRLRKNFVDTPIIRRGTIE